MKIIISSFLIFLTFRFSPAFAQIGGFDLLYYDLINAVFLTVIITAIIGGVFFYLYRRKMRKQHFKELDEIARANANKATDEKIATLKERLAKGEITKEEYDELKKNPENS